MATRKSESNFDLGVHNLMYDGATVAQLGKMFELTKNEVMAKLAPINPDGFGEDRHTPLYLLKNAAPFLTEFKGDLTRHIDERMKKMGSKDLPPSLQREYWGALTARMEYETAQGDLWPTGTVVETLAEVFKTMRMQLLLLTDILDKSSGLTDQQRSIVRRQIDSTLNGIHDALIKKFENEPDRKPDGKGGWSEDNPDDPTNDL